MVETAPSPLTGRRESAPAARQPAAAPRTGVASIVPPPRSEDAAGRGPRRAAPARLARAAAVLLGRRLAWGSIVIDDGTGALRLGSGEPEVRVRVNDARAYTALLLHGSVGLGEGYIEGWWDSDELTDLVRVLVANRGLPGTARDRLGGAASTVTDPLRRLRRRAPAEDRRHVRAHYDLGNELFRLMLDATLSYSCAIFERADMSLEEASLAKLDRICRKLHLGPGDEVVEIGTGWGAFALHAASRYGCRVTTTTLSSEQYEYAREAVARCGLTERVTVLEEDYRELRGEYDKLVSIEMIEAVDWRLLETYFRTCARLLRPHGLMALQAITIADQSYDRAKHGEDFVKRFIFPGGCIPSVAAIARAASITDLRFVDLEDIGRHYAETLRRWRGNVARHHEEILRLGFDERFLRMWRLYLCYCEGAFLERHLSDVQVVLAKARWRAPLAVRT